MGKASLLQIFCSCYNLASSARQSTDVQVGGDMKRRCHRLKNGLTMLTLVLLVCGCTGGDDQGPLFQDDFDNSTSGWGTDHRREFERGYEGGEYFIELYEPNWFAWAYPGRQFDDVSVEVDVYLASGSQDGHFGVFCRHVDVGDFYYFAISADGYYAIFRRVNGGDLKVLTGDGSGMVLSPAIRTGWQTNRVVVVCQGDEMSLYVNGELLEAVIDDAHTGGDVGLGAVSGPKGDACVRFDNFLVTRP